MAYFETCYLVGTIRKENDINFENHIVFSNKYVKMFQLSVNFIRLNKSYAETPKNIMLELLFLNIMK